MDTQKIGSPKLPQVQKSLLEPGTEEVIPEGYCQCGCGGKTKLAPQTNRKLGWVRGEPIKFMVGHWANLGLKGKKPHNYNGGIAKTGKNGQRRGYLDIHVPDHPQARGHGYVFEHRLIAEKALGKYLPEKAVIHHHTLEQIVICQDQAYHALLHQRTRALAACGHASWLKCVHCQEYDPLEKLVPHSRGSFIHSECRKERLRLWREKNAVKRREYAQKNREKINENQRKRRAA